MVAKQLLPQQSNIKKVALYQRVSTADQVKDGTSLDDQRRVLELYAKQQGWKIVDCYSDGGVSGGSINRPELQRLRKDAKAGKFTAILFTKLDRLGRNLRDIENLYHEFEEIGVELICVSDPSLNSSGKMAKVIRALMGTFAEFEKETIKERTSSGRLIKWKNGTAFMGELPFGYEKEYIGLDKKIFTGKIIINEERAAIYRRIVSMYLDQRLSSKKIAIQLTREGLLTPTAMKGKKVKKAKSSNWNPVTILNMLKNPAYMGEGIYNKVYYEQANGKSGRHRLSALVMPKPKSEWIKVDFPEIISPEIFRQIHARLETQKIKPKRIYKGYESHFLLDGLLYCGECGSRLHKRVKMEKDGKVRLYYTCYWRGTTKEELNALDHAKCNLKSVNADEIDRQLFGQISDLLVEPKSFIESWFRDLDFETLQSRVTMLEEKDRQLKKKLADGFDLITEAFDLSTKKIYLDGQKKIEREWQGMQMDLSNAQAELENAKHKTQRYESFKNEINKPAKGLRKKFKTEGTLRQFLYSLPFEEKKRLVESIVAPEQGGKCFIQYIRPIDYLDNDELQKVSKDKWKLPQVDREPYAHASFMVDFDRIEKVINSLNRGNLLNKANKNGRTLAYINGGYP